MQDDDSIPSHDCEVCDRCLLDFFSRLELSNILDLPAILRTPHLRDAIVKFYGGGIQYAPSITVLLILDWG